MQRATSELQLAAAVFKLSTQLSLKGEFDLSEDATFFSNVISNAYYCVFYAAKGLLISKGIETAPPEEHKKTLNAFEKLCGTGEIDVALLRIYHSAVVKADELLGIFKKEKSKRGKFTYQKLPQANLVPAEESLHNAEKFLREINLLLK